MLAISWAYEHRQADIKKMMRERDMEECLAREKVKGMFKRVREMVRRFMTRVGDGRTAQPGPMDWILETRTYGMNIRFNTTAGGSIDWNDRRVQYKRIAFDMDQLTEMFYAVVEEAKNLLADLAMVSEDGIKKLPKIQWNEFEDDMSEDAVGHSFLRDRRNSTWLSKGKRWNVNQIRASKVLLHEWISNDQHQGQPYCPYRMKAIKDHGKKLDKFREKLWLLVHMLSGQPARATEILGIRHQNTSNGGTRNIFISKGEVCFVTAYHKNFQQTNQAKIIHRFLPRAVGELLVWYLWLVLPFWQDVQGMLKGADKPSAFLWGEEIASVSQTRRGEQHRRDMEECGDWPTEHSPSVLSDDDDDDDDDDNDDNDDNDEEFSIHADRFAIPADGKNWFKEKKWTSDRVRRIMQQHSERLLGCKLNVSIWRHVAISIFNRLGTERMLPA
ncbi:hypothetical protein E4U48_000121 [Claviceps purpurea]|nr:hypothetical protein E4U48_000121 [Claviceps purpurea]